MDLLILTISVFLNILLGLAVFLRNRKSATNILFFALTIDVALWSIANYFSLHPSSPLLVIIWMRIVMFFAVPQAVLFMLLILTFPNTKIQLNKILLAVIAISSLFTMGICLSPYLFTGVTYANNTYSPVPGPGMASFMLVAFVSLLVGAITLIKKFLNARGRQKEQLKLILIGLVSMFILIVTFNFILVLVFNNSNFVSFGPLNTIPFVGAVAYAVIRYKFLDVKSIIARSITYVILIFVVVVIYSVLAFNVGNYFLGISLNRAQQTLLLLLTVFVVVSFQPIEHFIQEITDKLFFRGRYNSDKALGELSHIMASTLKLDDLTHGILIKLISNLRISKAAFVLLNKDRQIAEVKSESYGEPPVLDEEDIKLISVTRTTLVFDDMEESPEKQVMRKMDISLAVHLRTEGQQVGILFLGAKESGDIYSERDMNLLEICASEAAVAIQNAMSYEEIHRFNITLQEEVDKAVGNLKSANTQLQELDRLKDEFVSLASHELRTPMTAIRGSLSTILEGFAGDISPQVKEFLTAAYNENDRLIRLVNNLLNISRIESGRFTFALTRVSLDETITEVVGNLEAAAIEKGLYLKYEHDGPMPLIDADEDKVKEVLINIIGNAIKFTHVGGVTVKAYAGDGQVITSITDTGSGIAQEDQELLFKKFSQVQGNYARTTGGTGLGLYICKIIIEGLAGKIWLDSESGKGSTFHFSLPISH